MVESGIGGRAGRAARWVRCHALLYLGVNAVLLAVDLLTAGPVWSLYPLLFWGVALAMHHYLVKSLLADPGWAERRSARLRVNSYDIKHIDQIEAAPRGAGQLAADPGAAPSPAGQPPRGGGSGRPS